MSTDMARAESGTQIAPEILEQVVAGGDLSKLTPAQRVAYYRATCQSVGLNPLTRPFQYITLNAKLTLYATRDATDQLARLHHVTRAIVSRERLEDIYVVTARCSTPDSRSEESIGAVTIGALKGDGLCNALMKAECVPLTSQILTRDGFKRHDEVLIGEEVLAYDTASDTTRWTPLRAVTVYPASPLISLHTAARQFNVVCTPQHSWAVKLPGYKPDTRGKGTRGPRGPYATRGPERRLVEATAINTGHRLILAAPETGSTESLLTAHEAALLGWAVTDGTIKRVGNSVRIGICQSKESNFHHIREVVRMSFSNAAELVTPATTRTFPTGRTYATKEQHWWYLPSGVSRALLDKAGFRTRADLPRIVTRLSPVARRAMLQAFMLAEGDARGTFYNTDRHLLDAFQLLCAVNGVATGTEHVANRAGHRIVSQRLKRTRHVAGNFLHHEPVDAGPVWCPTTDLGTWVMRQGTQVTITGNTKAKRRATLSLVGLGWLDETEIETIPDARPARVDVATGEITADPVPPAAPAMGDRNGHAVYPAPPTAAAMTAPLAMADLISQYRTLVGRCREQGIPDQEIRELHGTVKRPQVEPEVTRLEHLLAAIQGTPPAEVEQ